MQQDDLMLERKLGMMDWSKRVNMPLFGIFVVDAWLVYSKCTETEESQREIYEYLAEEMIDNMHYQVSGRQLLDTAEIASPELITATGHL